MANKDRAAKSREATTGSTARPVSAVPERPIAVLCADLHISHRPPIARAEEDWYQVQAGYLKQLRDVASQHRCPIICAGDVLDNWRSIPETINFALKHLPKLYTIPGNHDLPCHSYNDVRKSAYWTLVESGRIINIPVKDSLPILTSNLVLYGFPFGFPVHPIAPEKEGLTYLAVVHEFVWTNKTGYVGAPEKAHLRAFRERCAGFHAVVVGDNHCTFLASKESPVVFNPGGFMRRKSNERNHRPCVGLLYAGGRIERHYLDVSKDKFVDLPGVIAKSGESLPGLQEFLEELGGLGEQGVSYLEAVVRYLDTNQVGEFVRRKVLAILEAEKT